MTAAMVRAAAAIVEACELDDNAIVTFTELGSEGAVFYIGTWKDRGARCIDRSGRWSGEIGSLLPPSMRGAT